jgi:hypothetical protein
MKRIKALALLLIALLLSPIAAHAFDIPLLTWERGRQQQVVLGGGAYTNSWKVSLEGNGEEPLVFSASNKNDAGYVVYSLNIPADLPVGAYTITTVGEGSPRTVVAGVSLIEAQTRTASSSLIDLTLIVAIFVFLTGIISTIRGRKYSYIPFKSEQVLPRLTDSIIESDKNFWVRLEEAPYRVRVRAITSLNQSLMRFLLIREGELLHRISKKTYGVAPLVGAIAGVIASVEVSRNNGIAATPMTIFIVVAAIAILDSFSGLTATLGFWAIQLLTGNLTSFKDFLIALAVGIAWVGPSLFASILREVIGRDFSSQNSSESDSTKVVGVIGASLVGASVFYLGQALVGSVIFTEQQSRQISLVHILIVAALLLVRGFADGIVLNSKSASEVRDESFFIARVASPITALLVTATVFAFVYIWIENPSKALLVALIFGMPYFLVFIRFGSVKFLRTDRLARNILLESAITAGITFIIFRQISSEPLLTDQRASLLLLLAGIAPALHAIYSAIYSSNEAKFSFEEKLEIIEP